VGGTGRKATTLPSDVDDYAWAPDGKRIALVAADADTAKPKTPAPIVIDRFQFKQDERATSANSAGTSTYSTWSRGRRRC